MCKKNKKNKNEHVKKRTKWIILRHASTSDDIMYNDLHRTYMWFVCKGIYPLDLQMKLNKIMKSKAVSVCNSMHWFSVWQGFRSSCCSKVASWYRGQRTEKTLSVCFIISNRLSRKMQWHQACHNKQYNVKLSQYPAAASDTTES